MGLFDRFSKKKKDVNEEELQEQRARRKKSRRDDDRDERAAKGHGSKERDDRDNRKERDDREPRRKKQHHDFREEETHDYNNEPDSDGSFDRNDESADIHDFREVQDHEMPGRKNSVAAEDADQDPYADLEWPVIQRINPVNVKDHENDVIEETVSPERKDEIGEMVFDEDLSPDTLKFLSGQELLFLLTTMEVFNRKSPLPEFKANHRKVYNELIDRLRNAKSLFVLYDNTTGYPFIDNGFANVYFEKELAEKVAGIFEAQFRKLTARECPIEVEGNDPNKKNFYDFLYYVGIENLIVDNGAYRARIKRKEIMPSPMEWGRADNDKSPKNPELNFAMLDFLEELKWPVKYEKRPEVLKAKELRMLSLLRNAKFMVPMQHEGPAEMGENGQLKFTKDTKIRFLVMKTKDDKQFLPIYTDGFEFSKLGREAGVWNVGIFSYRDIVKFAMDKDGVRINPQGHGLVITKERIAALENDLQKAAAATAKKAPAKPVGPAADDAVQQALKQAMSDLNSDK